MVVQTPFLRLHQRFVWRVLRLVLPKRLRQLLGELVYLLQKIVALILVLDVLKVPLSVDVLGFRYPVRLELVVQFEVFGVFAHLVLHINVVFIGQN